MPQLRHDGWPNRHRKSPRVCDRSLGGPSLLAVFLPSSRRRGVRLLVPNRRPGRLSVVAETLGDVIENDVIAAVLLAACGDVRGDVQLVAAVRGELAPGWTPSTSAPRRRVASRGPAITKTPQVAMGQGVLTSVSRSTSLSSSSNICSRLARVGWSGPTPRVASPARQLVPVALDCRGLRAGCAGAGEGIPPGPAPGHRPWLGGLAGARVDRGKFVRRTF
jgi:hypothetical protein